MDLPTPNLWTSGPPRTFCWDCLPGGACAQPLDEILLEKGLAVETRRAPDFEGLVAQAGAAAQYDLLLLAFAAEQVDMAAAAVSDLRQREFPAPILVACELEAVEPLERLHRAGVADFLSLPLRRADVLARLVQWLGGRRERAPEAAEGAFGRIIGRSPSLLAQIAIARRYSRQELPIVISGESGTGKEVLARAVHEASPRAGRPFVACNCSSLSADLVENELFGHEAGAYTGAREARKGLTDRAEGGTMLLDEVDSLPLPVQAKLLRWLQEGEFRRLGSAETRHANVRMIAATNADLLEAVHKAQFRLGLYFRLNVLSLRLPPLRERREDIPLLANHLLQKHSARAGPLTRGFAPGAMRMLLYYDWPGNVRGLENVVLRALALSEGPLIAAGDLFFDTQHPQIDGESLKTLKNQAIYQFEHQYLIELLIIYHGNMTHAAAAIGKNRRALFELLRKHHLGANEHGRQANLARAA